MIGLNNKKIGFIVDSSSNLKDGSIDDVKVVPLIVTVQQNGNVKSCKDGIDFNDTDLKLALESKDTIVKTSQASMPDMMKVAQEMCAQYDIVFVLPIHKNLSSNLNTWRILQEDFPKLNIVMTCDIGASFAWTLEEIKNFLKTNEATEASVTNFVNTSIIPNRIGFLMVEDLEQLVKGGRVSNAKAFFAKLFKIKPIILFSQNGLTSLDKAKDHESFFKVVDKYLIDNFQGKKAKRVILFVPSNDEEVSNAYNLEYGKHYGNLPFETHHFPTVVVSHTGLKHVAIYFELE